MTLSPRLLLELLEERLTVTESRLEEGGAPLGRPLLYEPGRPVEAGQLYLTAASAPQLRRRGICTLYVGGAALSGEGGSAICLKEGLETVLNQVQAIFDQLERWRQEMERLALEGGDLQTLLKESLPVLGNPVLVMGLDFSLTAQAGEELLPSEQRLFGEGVDSMELFNALKQDEMYDQMRLERRPFLYPAHIVGWRSWNLNLEREGQATHRLVLIECQRPLREGDGDLLELMAPYVDSLLARERAASRSAGSLRALFIRILSDRTADYIEVSRQLSRLGWAAEDEYFCLVFNLDQRDQATNFICGYLEKHYPHSCSFPYQEDVVTFFNTTKAGKSLEEIAGEMKYFIRESYVKAGYSRAMTGHGSLRRQYVQACVALDVGSRIRPYLWIHHFDAVAFTYLLEQATRRLPGDMLCHRGLLTLRENDERHGTEYLRTLRVYLDQHLNAVQSARELFIHRSTFLYRLERIKELLESHLDDPEELLYLSISLRLLDNEQKKN